MSESQKRLAFFLPNVFTALNMACGVVSILLSYKGLYYQASMIILLGAVFDSVDGRVARLMGGQSDFGEQFDSLSDLISFGMAPALMFYWHYLEGLGRVGIVLTILYVLCGALRLARFNVSNHKYPKNFFQGFPIPAAAMTLIGHNLLTTEFRFLSQLNILASIVMLLTSLMMISRIPFASFKDSTWAVSHKKLMLLMIVTTIGLIALYEEVILGAFMYLYLISGPIYFLFKRKSFQEAFNYLETEET